MAQNQSYLESLMMDEDREKIAKYKSDYAAASAAGNTAAMEQAHAAAEAVRGKYGFSGGADGSADITPEDSGIAGRYDSALVSKTNALKAGIDSNLLDIERQKGETTLVYQEEQNRIAGLNASQTRSVNEQAVAAGLSSGTRSQQSVAMSNIYQANSAKLGRELSGQLGKLEDERLKLIINYRAAVAEAISKNESEKAAALYEEYQRRQKENAALAKTQVDAMLRVGAMPSAELVKLTGYSQEYINAMLGAYQQSTVRYSGGGGSGGGSSKASSSSGSIIGSDDWYMQLYRTYGSNAENMIRYHYSELGLKSGNVSAAVEGYARWMSRRQSQLPSSAPTFSDILRTCQTYLQSGNTTKAKSNAQTYFSGLSASQKTELSALFTRYGVKL